MMTTLAATRLLSWQRWTVPVLAAGLLIAASRSWGQDKPPKSDAPKANAPKTDAAAQPPARTANRGPRGPLVVSPEVSKERKVTFRVQAPKAEEVTLNSS